MLELPLLALLLIFAAILGLVMGLLAGRSLTFRASIGEALVANTLPATAFAGVVVFTGEAQFKTDLGGQVIYLRNLLEFMEQQRPVVLDERKMAYVVGRLEMKRLPRSLETDEYHLNYVRKRIKTT